MKLQFSRQILVKNTKISNFTKILPVGACLFHADGRIDRYEEADNRFSQICEGA